MPWTCCHGNKNLNLRQGTSPTRVTGPGANLPFGIEFNAANQSYLDVQAGGKEPRLTGSGLGFCVYGWVRLKSAGLPNPGYRYRHPIFSRGSSTTNTFSFEIYYDDVNQVNYFLEARFPVSAWTGVVAKANVVDTWALFVINYDPPAGNYWYANMNGGAISGGIVIAPATDQGGQFTIGRMWNTARSEWSYLHGAVAGVGCARRTITYPGPPDNMAALYNSGAGVACGPV